MRKEKDLSVKLARLICCLPLCLLPAGCFEHREAPARLVSATGMDEASARRATVEQIDLCGAELEHLPHELADMPRLRHLLLRGARVAGFDVLGDLAALRLLDLSATQLTAVPAGLAKLGNLKHLYLADNGLAVLPDELAGLSTLEYLNLDRNRLTALPDALGALTNLRWIRLNQNELATLPACAGSWRQLQRLYARDNRLETLPPALDQCLLLEDLALSQNRIAVFPEVLTRLPKLRSLDLAGNPLTGLPVETIARMEALRFLTLTGCRVPPDTQRQLRAALPNCLITF
jgi:Leucine-rich repeat (LRR) protein